MDADDHELLMTLVDERAISRRLLLFARCLDEKDFVGYAGCYTEDGVLRTPRAEHRGRAGLADFVEAELGRYEATQHVSAAHDIAVTRDVATVRQALLATHVTSVDGKQFWTVGGWYDMTLRREGGEWLLASVVINRAWVTV